MTPKTSLSDRPALGLGLKTVRTLRVRSFPTLDARVLLSGITSVFLAGMAHGQSQIQSPSQQPPGERAGEDKTDAVLSIPELRGLRAPDGAELKSFSVGTILLEGGLEDINARAAALAPAPGATLSVEELFKYAGLVQSLYFDAGYPLVRVVVPAQDIEPLGSTVKILVINGYVDAIDTAALPARVARRVEKVLSPLIGEVAISASELERRILLAGDTAGLRLRSALTPGVEIGATSLVLTGDHSAVDGVISLDNRVIEDVGREQVTASLALNSVFGRGEQLVLTGATALEDPEIGESALRSYTGLSASLPVGTEGWSIGLQLLHASNAPEPVGGAAFDNTFFRVGLSAAYALERSRRASSVLSFGVDASYEEQRLQLPGLQASLFADRTRVARAGFSGYGHLGDQSQLTYDIQVSKGIDGLGARNTSDATALRPLSREGADAGFAKISVGGSLKKDVYEWLSLQAAIRAQTSFNQPLVRSEQASFVSPGLVSGPPSGSVTGDRMIAGRMEAQTSVQISDVVNLQPYISIAAGESHLENPTALERRHSGGRSLGLGLRAAFDVTSEQTLSAQLEWASVDSDDQRLERDWFGFSVAVRF